MKRVLFPSILIATILTGGLLAFAIWKASPESSEDFLASGKKFYDEQKYAEAIVQFLNAIQKDEKNRDARYYIALSYLNRGELQPGAQHLHALLEFYPEDVDANIRLGNLYLIGGRSDPEFFRQASEIADKLLAKDEKNVQALILKANAASGKQDYKTAVELLEKAIILDPQNAGAYVSLGTAKTLQKNFGEAEQAFLQAREANPKDASVLTSLGNYYRIAGKPEKAEEIFKGAISQDDSNRRMYLQLIDLYFQTGRFDEVEKILREFQTKNAEDPGPSLLLSDLLIGRGRQKEAQDLLLDLQKKYPDSLNVSAKIALNFLQSDPEKAKVEIDRILQKDPKNAVGTILRGEQQYLAGDIDGAKALFEKEMNGTFPQPHFFLGNIATQKGQLDQAEEHFQKSLAINAGFIPARVALAELLLKRGRLADSRVEVRRLMSMQSNLLSARLLKASLDRLEKNYSEAERELTTLVKEAPNNVLIHRELALYYGARNRPADAEKSMLKALELRPDSNELLGELTQLYFATNQPDRAIQRINSVPEEKKTAFHHELLGNVYSAANKVEDAEKAYKKALEKDPSRNAVNMSLAGLYIKNGRKDEGLKKLDEVVAKDANNATAIATRGMIYEEQGKLEEAKQNYTQALKANPNLETAANNLAFLLAEEGRDLNTALGYAQIARKSLPENANIADTMGWVYYKLGNYIMAREQLRFAISKEPDHPVFNYHMGMIYKANNQRTEAETALKKAVASTREFKEKALAQAALKELGGGR